MALSGLRMFGVCVVILIVTSVTVRGQDEPEYFLEQRTYSIREGDGSLRVTVGRDGTGVGAIRLRLDGINANPATAEDYDTSDLQLDFTGSEESEFDTIEIIDDGVYEGDGETFQITLSVIDGTPGTVRAGSNTAVVTILDNDSLFFIDESKSDLNVREDDELAVITITRQGYLINPASVSFSTDEIGNADERDDYIRTNIPVSFGQNTASRTVEIEIINDNVMETASEIFDVVLTNPTNGELGSPFRSAVTITDDDGVYEFTSATYVISESASRVQVCVTRTSEDTLQQREVLLTTSTTVSNTATANADYRPLTSTTGTLVFGAGDNIECADISILGDSQVESSETFTVEIAETEGELGDDVTATVTITDDDATFQFQESTAQVSENAGSLTITVVREGYLQTTGTVRVVSALGSAFAPNDFTSINSFESFSSSVNGLTTQTVTINIESDDEDEPDEVFYLDLVSPSGGTIGSPERMTITILDDDEPPTERPPSDGLEVGALIGIIVGAVVAALALLGLITLLCCSMGCPCCPWCAGKPQKVPLVEQEPQRYYQQPQQVFQPIQAIQQVPYMYPVAAIENQIVPLGEYNAAF